MAKQFDADQDYDDFETWFQDLSEATFGDYAFTWMETLKAGAVIVRSGYSDFQGWVFDKYWPEVRMAREMDRLTCRAEAARWAA